MVAERGDVLVLRAKYLDWCSARIADRFVQLTPDEIYELAQEARRRDAKTAVDDPSGGTGAAPSRVDPTYRQLVEGVTAVLAGKMDLPSFDDWAEAYRAEPERYESELLGLWRMGDEARDAASD